MIERLGFFVFTYLLGYGILRFGWAWCRRAPTREQVARRLLLCFAGTVMALLIVEIVGFWIEPASCSPGCMGGCWFPPDTVSCSFGLGP